MRWYRAWCVHTTCIRRQAPIQSFDDRFNELVSFKAKYDHCNVSTLGEDASLGKWCSVLRSSYKKIQNNPEAKQQTIRWTDSALDRCGFQVVSTKGKVRLILTSASMISSLSKQRMVIATLFLVLARMLLIRSSLSNVHVVHGSSWHVEWMWFPSSWYFPRHSSRRVDG